MLLLVEVASFDLRFGAGLPRDRYLFYAAPLLLAGFVGAVTDLRPPRLSLAVPLAVVVAGLALAPFPLFDKLNADTPVSILDDYIRANGGRTMLIGATLLLVAIAMLGRFVLPRRLVVVVLVTATAAALVGETAYAFDRLFRVNGTSGRPITLSQGIVFDWIDREIGPDQDVTMIPYAQIQGDYWATAGFWWDPRVLEPLRDARRLSRQPVRGDPVDVPEDRPPVRPGDGSRLRLALALRRRERPGLALPDPGHDGLVDAQCPADRRGRHVAGGLGVERPRRRRLHRSGPRRAGARVPARRPAAPGHALPDLPRARPPGAPGSDDRAHYRFRHGDHDADVGASVCVPTHGFATVRIRGRGSTRVYGDLGARAGIYQARVRGMQIDRISLADETSSC